MVERGMANRALAEVLAGVGFDAKAKVAAVAEELERVLERLVARAQAAGAVRSDVGMAEIHVLLSSVHLAAERTGGDKDTAMRVTVVCDGLRHVSE